jgi:hypothetical protein
MRRIYLVGLALFAVLAYGALAVTSAFADETALFLNNGTEILAGEEIAVDGAGELTLTTLVGGANAASVDCSGVLHGTLLTGGLDLINELLSLTDVAIPLTALTGTGLSCEVLTSLLGSCGTVGELAQVWAINLPWLTVVLLMTTVPVFLIDIVNSGAGAPGYYVLCPGAGAKTNTCTGKTSFEVENETGGLFNEFGEGAIASEKASCTEGGVGAGDISGHGLTESTAGLTITVSE